MDFKGLPVFLGIVVFSICLQLPLKAFCEETPDTEENTYITQLTQRAEKLLLTEPDSAFIYASKALRLSDQTGYALGAGNSHQLIGTVFYHQGVYLQSLDHLLKAEEIFRSLYTTDRLAANLNQQGLVYYNIRQPDLALQHHQEALSIYKQAGLKNGIGYSLGCIGRLYEKKQEYDKALRCQHEALTYYKEVKDQQGIATILENIGSIYEDLEEFSKALDHFNRSLRLNELTADSLSMIINLNNIGDNYRKTGNYASAIEYSTKALTLAKRLNERYQVSSAYKDLSKLYNMTGEYQKAYDHLETGRTLYEEIFAQDAAKQLALLQTLFETERQNHAIRQLEDAQKLDTVIKIALTSGLSLMVVLGVVIISRQRLKIKRDKEESERNRQVYEAQRKLMEAELANTHLQEQKMQDELDARAKSLTTHTLHIMEKNKMLEDIQVKLSDSLKEEHQEQRKKIKNLLKMIDHNFSHDKDWNDFRNIFEKVHQDFFEKLGQLSPDLTAADLRLAALFRINMPSKDMATVLGISPDSLRIARYRLRKKLQLPAGENLSRYLHSL